MTKKLDEEFYDHGDKEDYGNLGYHAVNSSCGEGRAHEEHHGIAGEDLGWVVVEVQEGQKGACQREKNYYALGITLENGEEDNGEGHDYAKSGAEAIEALEHVGGVCGGRHHEGHDEEHPEAKGDGAYPGNGNGLGDHVVRHGDGEEGGEYGLYALAEVEEVIEGPDECCA